MPLEPEKVIEADLAFERAWGPKVTTGGSGGNASTVQVLVVPADRLPTRSVWKMVTEWGPSARPETV
jgi:hypothetical protein